VGPLSGVLPRETARLVKEQGESGKAGGVTKQSLAPNGQKAPVDKGPKNQDGEKGDPQRKKKNGLRGVKGAALRSYHHNPRRDTSMGAEPIRRQDNRIARTGCTREVKSCRPIVASTPRWIARREIIVWGGGIVIGGAKGF